MLSWGSSGGGSGFSVGTRRVVGKAGRGWFVRERVSGGKIGGFICVEIGQVGEEPVRGFDCELVGEVLRRFCRNWWSEEELMVLLWFGGISFDQTGEVVVNWDSLGYFAY